MINYGKQSTLTIRPGGSGGMFCVRFLRLMLLPTRMMHAAESNALLLYEPVRRSAGDVCFVVLRTGNWHLQRTHMLCIVEVIHI